MNIDALKKIATAFLFGALFLAGCSDQESGPNTEELRKKLAIELPSIWELSDFKVEVSENTGTKTEPNVKARFSGELTLARDLYEVARTIGDTPVLNKIAAKGEKKLSVFGIAQSKRQGEGWKSSFSFENPGSLRPDGRPLDDFGANYALAGSPEEQQAQARYEENEKKKLEEIEKAQAARIETQRRIEQMQQAEAKRRKDEEARAIAEEKARIAAANDQIRETLNKNKTIRVTMFEKNGTPYNTVGTLTISSVAANGEVSGQMATDNPTRKERRRFDNVPVRGMISNGSVYLETGRTKEDNFYVHGFKMKLVGPNRMEGPMSINGNGNAVFTW